MEERDIHKMMLNQYARRLYSCSGKFNAYISLSGKTYTLKAERLKSEIQMIRNLAAVIEIEIDNI